MVNFVNRRIADKYNNIAAAYDVVDWFIPSEWRRQATHIAYGRVLEVGVGTGLNLPFYNNRCSDILGIDISSAMLEKAKQRALHCNAPVTLDVMDVQDLSLESGSLDSILAAFVFCTVPDPLQGLLECRRVLKDGGSLILLEHVGSEKKLLRWAMDSLNPLTVRLMGDHINRDTARIVAEAGFGILAEKRLWGDVVRLIQAVR